MTKDQGLVHNNKPIDSIRTSSLEKAFIMPSNRPMDRDVVVAVALAVAGWVVWHCPDADLRAAVMIMTTLMVAPYWLSYDYGIAAAALLLHWPAPRQPGSCRR